MAGVRDGKLAHQDSGLVMSFEILLVSPAFERIVLPFKKNLEKLGVDARVRLVDSAQYQNRINEFDFDVAVTNFVSTLSPGNEQRELWGSASADLPGSRNVIGIKSQVIDGLIEEIIAAADRVSLVAATHALDRILLWNHYVIPNWYSGVFRIARWDRFFASAGYAEIWSGTVYLVDRPREGCRVEAADGRAGKVTTDMPSLASAIIST